MRLTAALVLALCAAGLGAQTASPEATVFEVARPSGHDVLELTTGDQLRGTLRDERLSVQTSYALIALPPARIAGIDRSSEEGDAPPLVEHLVACNGDEFLGIGVEQTIHFEIAGGRVVEIPRELLRRLVMRLPAQPPALPRNQHFGLQGGDHFSGRLHHEGPLLVRAPFGTVSLNMAEVSAIIPAQGGEHGRVTMLTGTDTAGDPQLDRITVTLDVLDGLAGAPIDLAPERVTLILAQAGALPDDTMLTTLARRHSRSLIEGSVAIDPDGTPAAGQITAETDTYHFRGRAGRSYTLETRNIVNIDTFIRLLGTDARTSLGENDDGGGSLASRLEWRCPEDGLYYLQVWRLGMGPDVPPSAAGSYGYPAGDYEVVITEHNR